MSGGPGWYNGRLREEQHVNTRTSASQTRRFHRALSPMRATSLLWPALPLLIAVAIALFVMSGNPAALPELFMEVLREFWREEPVEALIAAVGLILGAAFLGLAWLRLRHASLVIDPTGIRCQPAGHGLRLLLQDPRRHGWRLSWADIQQARLIPPGLPARNVQTLAMWKLRLHTPGGVRELIPWLWLEADTEDHRVSILTAMRRPDEAKIQAWVADSPLIQALTAHGVEVHTELPDTTNPLEQLPGGRFDLASHKGMLAQLGLFFVVGGYALVDGLLLQPWEALEPLPLMPFAATAIAAACLVGVLGRGAPQLERMTVAALCVAVITTAVWPGLLRFNAATDPSPQVYEYHMTQPGIFQTGNDELPTLDLRHLEVQAYWRSLEPPEHEFRLYRGEAGFWQLDRGHLFERTRAFYARR